MSRSVPRSARAQNDGLSSVGSHHFRNKVPCEAHGCRQVQHGLLVPLVWVCNSPKEVPVSTATKSASLLNADIHMISVSR